MKVLLGVLVLTGLVVWVTAIWVTLFAAWQARGMRGKKK